MKHNKKTSNSESTAEFNAHSVSMSVRSRPFLPHCRRDGHNPQFRVYLFLALLLLFEKTCNYMCVYL